MDVTCLSERARLSSRVIMKPGVKSWTRFTSFACSRDSIPLRVRGRAFGRAPSRSDNNKKKTTLVLKSSWTSGLCSLPPALEETMNTHYGVQQQWYGRWLCVRKASRETISVLFVSAQRSILVTGWRRSSEQGRLRKPAAEPSGGWVFILDEWHTDGLPSLIIYFKSKKTKKTNKTKKRKAAGNPKEAGAVLPGLSPSVHPPSFISILFFFLFFINPSVWTFFHPAAPFL